MSRKDQILLRAKDISLLILVFTILGILGTQFKHVYRWDEAADKVEKIEIRTTVNEQNTAVISSKLEAISEQLRETNSYLRRMQSNGRNP